MGIEINKIKIEVDCDPKFNMKPYWIAFSQCGSYGFVSREELIVLRNKINAALRGKPKL
jgi:sugar/nucleoside kinase (ribokinase family)